MITLTRAAWGKFAPKCPAAWTDALFGNLDFLEQHGILETELRWCHFAGTIYAETGGFRYRRENLYYTTLRALRNAWPSRFGHMTDSQARAFLRNPRGLANKVYNGRMGNRPGSSDGYDFRGGGWIQTTGRSAVEEYAKQLGVTPGPMTLDDPVITLQFAVLEWTNQDCNKWADENDILKIAKAINTGSADSNVKPNGMTLREDAFKRAWTYWGEYSVADAPKPISKRAVGFIATGAGSGVGLIAQTAPTAVDTIMSDPVGSAEKAINTGRRVHDVAEGGRQLGAWAFSLPHWPVVLGAVAIAGSLYWLLCHYLPNKQEASP